MQGVGKRSSSRNDRSIKRNESIMDQARFDASPFPVPPSHIVILMVKVLFFVRDE